MKAIKTEYFGPGDRRGSRIKASDGDKNSVILSCDDSLDMEDNHKVAAYTLCARMGWLPADLIRGSFPKFDVWVFADSED